MTHTWPVLIHVNLFQINLDFDQKHKENSTNFYTKWHPFINKIISIKFNSSRDDTLASLYENIRQQPDDGKKIFF